MPERLDYLWFLGYGLDDRIPDHSVLSKARARWGREIFEELFIHSVNQCVAAGLVDGQTLQMDGSLIDVDASRDSVIKGDAACVSRGPGSCTARPRYKHHRAVDNQCGVITAVVTASGDVTEASQVVPLLEQHEVNTTMEVAAVVADRGYGTVDTYCALITRGVSAQGRIHTRQTRALRFAALARARSATRARNRAQPRSESQPASTPPVAICQEPEKKARSKPL